MGQSTRFRRKKNSIFEDEAQAQISLILWEVWDPIGVNDTPAARSEYDSYVSGISDLLTQGADDSKITARLRQLETVNMRLRGSSKTHLKRVIAAFREIDIETNARSQ